MNKDIKNMIEKDIRKWRGVEQHSADENKPIFNKIASFLEELVEKK